MLDYDIIHTKLNQLSDQYIRDVARFCDYSPIGRYTDPGPGPFVYQFETNSVDIAPIVSTERSLKNLLKTIHPDKIVLMFGTEMPTVSACASVIIQENMDFVSAVRFLNKELPQNVVDDILRKSNIRVEEQDHDDTCIDRHLDTEFIQLCRQYEKLRHCTLRGFVKRKLSDLFTNLSMDINRLLSSIARILYEAKYPYPMNAEELAMYREEHWLVFSLEGATISISQLAEHFPASSFSKTYTFVRDHVANNIDAHITISYPATCIVLNTEALLKFATQHVCKTFAQQSASK